MGQSVYVDLFFLINFSMDFLCFFLSSKLLSRKLSLPRALAASAIGGIYANLALFISFGKLISFALDIAVCAMMCAIAFYKRRSASSLPLYILVYFAISMALGGFMTAIFNLLNRTSLGDEPVSSDGISVWMFALLAAISSLITLIGSRFFRRKSAIRSAKIKISYKGRSTELCGMSDTGNLLRDPMSNKLCIIADTDTLRSILPPKIIGAAKRRDINELSRVSPSDAKNLRVVPMRTASGESILIALRADSVTLDSGKGFERVDALIALSNIEDSADGHKALIPSELM